MLRVVSSYATRECGRFTAVSVLVAALSLVMELSHRTTLASAALSTQAAVRVRLPPRMAVAVHGVAACTAAEPCVLAIQSYNRRQTCDRAPLHRASHTRRRNP